MYAVNYDEIASKAIELASTYKPSVPKQEPQSAAELGKLDFEVEIPASKDKYLYGNFVDGTHASKLVSQVDGEQGMYNIAVDPNPRTPYAFIFPTKDYHPQSAPLRPGYLLHAHRLIIALEKNLAAQGIKGKVVFIYDCGEQSGVIMGHKCLRGYVVDRIQVYSLPQPLESGSYLVSSKDDPLLVSFTSLLNTPLESTEAPAIPLQPSYNLILTKENVIIIPRKDDGFLGKSEGRWDGARLIGIPL